MINVLLCVAAVPVLWLSHDVPMMYLATMLATSLATVYAFFARPGLLLIYPFQLGLVTFVFVDGFADVGGLARPADIEAAQYICMSTIALHIGYWLSASPGRDSGNAVPGRYPELVTRWAILWLLAVEAIYLALSLKFTIASAVSGRSAALDEGGLNVTGRAFAITVAMTLPGLAAYWARHRYASSRRALLVSALAMAPIFASLFLQGNRFPLLFSSSIYLAVLYPGYLRPTRRIIVKSLAVILIGLSCSAAMVGMRNSVYGVESGGNHAGGLVKSEGILSANALMVDYFSFHPHTAGMSLLNIAFFWIPRAIWDEKPAFLGFWLARSQGSEDVADSHSIAFGIGGEAYADFGFAGGALACAGFGLIFAAIERVLARRRNDRGFGIYQAAVAIPFAFFAARNIDTALIMTVSILLLGTVLHRLLIRRPRAPVLPQRGATMQPHREYHAS